MPDLSTQPSAEQVTAAREWMIGSGIGRNDGTGTLSASLARLLARREAAARAEGERLANIEVHKLAAHSIARDARLRAEGFEAGIEAMCSEVEVLEIVPGDSLKRARALADTPEWRNFAASAPAAEPPAPPAGPR